jgi:hypothetical protein
MKQTNTHIHTHNIHALKFYPFPPPPLFGHPNPYLFVWFSAGLKVRRHPRPISIQDQPEAEFLDEIQTKILRVFLFATHCHLYSLTFRFLFLKTHAASYEYFQTHAISCVFLQLSYCTLQRRNEETLIENHTPFPVVKEIHTETSSLRTLKIMPRNIDEIVRS